MGVIITFPQARKLRLREVKFYFYSVLAAREKVQAQALESSVEWGGWVAFKGPPLGRVLNEKGVSPVVFSQSLSFTLATPEKHS